LDIAQKSYERVQVLFENEVVSAQKKDEAEANYKAMKATEQAAHAQYEMVRNGAQQEDKLAAEAQLNRAKGAVAEVESYLNETFLVSPVDGEISERYPNVGELVGTGAPIMDVMDPDDMWVSFNIREDLLGDIRMGETFTAVIPALKNKEITLKVTYMKDRGSYAAWRATKTTGQFDAKTFEVKAVPTEKVEGLRPGMSVLKSGSKR
jgi:HlyD family secretion protein